MMPLCPSLSSRLSFFSGRGMGKSVSLKLTGSFSLISARSLSTSEAFWKAGCKNTFSTATSVAASALEQTCIINRSIMKFVALALVFLLAAGCQAELTQSDAPNKYEHIRAGVVTYLTQAKESAQRAIDQLDDAEFKDYKARLTLALGFVEKSITSVAESLAPVREGLGPQLIEFFSATREKLSTDMEALRQDLEPKVEELREVVKKHLVEYRTLLEPALKEYTEKNQHVVEEFKTKFEPVVKELEAKIKVNVEETKSKLTPIVEIIRKKLTKALEDLKTEYGPHVQEYREQIETVTADLRSKYESGVLQEKLTKLAEELKPKLQDIYATVKKAFEA